MKKLVLLLTLTTSLLSAVAHAEPLTFAWEGWAPDGQRLYRTVDSNPKWNQETGTYTYNDFEVGTVYTLLPNMGQQRYESIVYNADSQGWLYTIDVRAAGTFTYTWDIVDYRLVRPRSWFVPAGEFFFPDLPDLPSAELEAELLPFCGNVPMPPHYHHHLPLGIASEIEHPALRKGNP